MKTDQKKDYSVALLALSILALFTFLFAIWVDATSDIAFLAVIKGALWFFGVIGACVWADDILRKTTWWDETLVFLLAFATLIGTLWLWDTYGFSAACGCFVLMGTLTLAAKEREKNGGAK